MHSPLYKSLPPLVLKKTSKKGLLKTPPIQPLRYVIWIDDPFQNLIDLIDNIPKSKFSRINQSKPIWFENGQHNLKLIKTYGENYKINLCLHSLNRQNLISYYSPLTKQIVSCLHVLGSR